jgi:sulfite reductase (NADPH) hemoprotein beta-component
MISDPNKPKKLSANEGIKENSDFLRGTISESLLDDSTGSIPASDAQLTKFHGTYLQDDRDKRMSLIKEKKEKAFSFMIRVRVPGGVCTPKQWIGIDDFVGQVCRWHLEVDYATSFSTSWNPQA